MNTIIKKLGDITTALNPIACIIFILFYFDYKVLIGFIITYAIGNILCQCIKGICDAKRPRDGGSHEVITIKPYSHEDGESCCSGHAMSSALPAYFILFCYEPIIFIPFFIINVICSWSRVYVKAHWLFDVLLSNIIAFFVMMTYAYILLLCKTI